MLRRGFGPILAICLTIRRDIALQCIHYCSLCLQKVHTFQASLESVLAQLGDAEQGQKTLTASNLVPSSEDPNTFRNQLKVN